jgi:dTDP-glucose 4,6-dehydratase
MAKRALVAGGGGVVGSHLCELLLSKGYEVVALDNFVTGRRANIENALKLGLKLVEADISKPFKVEGRFDEIYNLASPASPVDFKKMPIFILDTASAGHRNLLELAHAWKARILFASSSEAYGDAEVHPQHEGYFGNVNPVGARGCYDEAKRFGEALSMAYNRQHGVETRLARIFNTYGPRMRPDDGRIIPNFFTQALKKQALTVYGDGSQTRSFCFVTDLARSLYLLMQSSEVLPVNCGNPTERTVLEMATIINKMTGNTAGIRNLALPENDPKVRRPDTTKLERVTGWKPEVSLEDGLAKAYEYFKRELERNPSIEATVFS